MKRIALVASAAAALAIGLAAPADSQDPSQATPTQPAQCVAHPHPAKEQKALASRTFAPSRWKHPQAGPGRVRQMQKLRTCADPTALPAMRKSWRGAKRGLYRYADQRFRQCSPAECQLWASRRVSRSQMQCLVPLWDNESGWSRLAHNSSSGAHGIPQALPGSKMGAGWYSDGKVQMSWGLSYIADVYGSPCGAWSHWLGAGSY